MTDAQARWYRKANAVADAWLDLHPAADPPLGAVVLTLAVAQHETQCGDAWPGSNNWGAVTRRALDTAERSVITAAGIRPIISPTVARITAELDAAAALAKAGIPVPADCVLHIDSAPNTGAYFVMFAREATERDGARVLLRTLSRASELTILTAAKAPFADDAVALARVMYAAHYYTGFFKPGAWYDRSKAEVPHDTPGALPGTEMNMAAYGSSLVSLVGPIAVALVLWTPGAEPQPAPYIDPRTFDLGGTLGVQQALNYLVPSLGLAEDGVMGARTNAAIRGWQASKGLTADGIVGPKTRAALVEALSNV